MCTSIALTGKHLIFGRNMDLDGDFGGCATVLPRRAPLVLRRMPAVREHYAVLGMARTVEGYPLYADGMNEHGLCAAALDFSAFGGYAPDTGGEGLASFEVIPYLLATCKSVEEAREALLKHPITDIPFGEALPPTRLHFHIADSRTSLVAEPTAKGLKLYHNTVGVLTNDPPFPVHLASLSRIAHLTPKDTDGAFGRALGISPYGHGRGGVGLPGDATSASRFLRAAYLRYAYLARPTQRKEGRTLPATLALPQRQERDAQALLRLLAAVAVLPGEVVTEEGVTHATVYTAVMDTEGGCYTYTRCGGEAHSVRLADFADKDSPIEVKM